LYAFIFFLAGAAWPTHLVILHLISLIVFNGEYRLWSPSLCSFLQPILTSSLLDPSIFLSTLFSDTFNLSFFVHVRNQILFPLNTTGRITN
jgi:hypothetical protein